MPEYAPKAILGIYTAVHDALPYVRNGGIVGDRAHGTGYHRSRNALLRAGRKSDYSIQAAVDKRGDGDAASALDLTPTTREQQIQISKRLMAASLAKDPRLKPLREWFGTTNGKTVTGYSPYRGRYVSADSSHLWHIHLSIHRVYANDAAALAGIAEVIIGSNQPAAKPNGEEPTGCIVYHDRVTPGVTGSDSVWWVQRWLNNVVMPAAPTLELTGNYEAQTQIAAAVFQEDFCDDEADGDLGPLQTVYLYEQARKANPALPIAEFHDEA
jgi:hypothetical protein